MNRGFSHRAGGFGHGGRVYVLFLALVWSLGLSSPATAEPAERSDSTANLDGMYVALGPVASAVHHEGEWDGGFGGEISVVRVREGRRVAALGVAAGAIRYSTEARGRVWADVQLGTSTPFGLVTGVSAGVTAEIDETIPPRWGAQMTVWVFAGVIPYVRVGAVDTGGAYIDLGLKIALPAFRM